MMGMHMKYSSASCMCIYMHMQHESNRLVYLCKLV
jgi:hypothetical protein